MGSDDLSARPALPNESPQLTQLIRRAKAAWGYPQPWLTAWEAELSITAEYIQCEQVVVLEMGARILGFYGLELGGSPAILEHLWVDPDYMRRGLGGKLLQRACTAARSAGHCSMELVADPHAEAFYVRYGGIRIATQHSEVLRHARALPRMVFRLHHEPTAVSR